MLNLNNVPAQEYDNTSFELIPDGTVARGFVKLSGGDIDLQSLARVTSLSRHSQQAPSGCRLK